MDKPEPSAATERTAQPDQQNNLPPGNHPLEVGARRGIGPLSPLGREQWHGRAVPCVSCGQLVLRDTGECDHCGQDLGPEMLAKMRAHAWPWYVLDHVRPFPGVSLARIIRQVRRGLITETSIVRGPSTDYQWRFAVETPGLCRYFGRCWNCHEKVSPSDGCCLHCQSYLSFEKPPPESAVQRSASGGMGKRTLPIPPDADQSPERKLRVGNAVGQALPAETSSDHLKQLSAVVDRTDLPTHEAVWDEPPRIGGIRATWVAVVLLALVIVALMFLTRSRSREAEYQEPATLPAVEPIP